jgi:hypothetical protein
MIADIHKPDISTLLTTGHFYFGWTRKEEKIDLIVSINYPLAGLGGRGSVYVGLVATTRQREYSIS